MEWLPRSAPPLQWSAAATDASRKRPAASPSWERAATPARVHSTYHVCDFRRHGQARRAGLVAGVVADSQVPANDLLCAQSRASQRSQVCPRRGTKQMLLEERVPPERTGEYFALLAGESARLTMLIETH